MTHSVLCDVGFSLSLLCTGLLSTDVEVSILINITAAASPVDSLYLNIRRKKTCIRREHYLFTYIQFI